MTTHDRDKVIAAAIGCIEGPYDRSRAITITGNEIERLYAIAFEAGRQAEREDCAKVCESQEGKTVYGGSPGNYWKRIAKPRDCAVEIRARGDTK